MTRAALALPDYGRPATELRAHQRDLERALDDMQKASFELRMAIDRKAPLIGPARAARMAEDRARLLLRMPVR